MKQEEIGKAAIKALQVINLLIRILLWIEKVIRFTSDMQELFNK